MNEQVIFEIIKKEIVKCANEKSYQFKNDDKLNECIEIYYENEGMGNGYKSIEHYIDGVIKNYKEDVFK